MPGVNPVARSKPVVLAAAIKEDISPEACHIQDLAFDFQDEYYEVHNYDYVERERSPSPMPCQSRTTRCSCSLPPTWDWKTS